MPIIRKSTYKPPFYLINGHFETIIPNIFRKIDITPYQRELFETSDKDFIYLDWLRENSSKLLILIHGLEGDSSRNYVKGMAKLFHDKGYDVLAFNCRSCGGELNRNLKMYHHGDISDLTEILNAPFLDEYEKVSMIGFSMGGSMLLKYLGSASQPHKIQRAVAISVPCDLKGSSLKLNDWSNYIYRTRFLRKLIRKFKAKAALFPQQIEFPEKLRIRNFQEFDTVFSAPLNGFNDLESFYLNGSANQYLKNIRVPTLIINALNDPMLSEGCFPEDLVKNHPFVYLQPTARGGHVGFYSGIGKPSWAESRALEFIDQERI
jgi:predicted alpha/beta-fold hydrolase